MFMLLPEEEEEFEGAEDRNEKCNHITDRYSEILTLRHDDSFCGRRGKDSDFIQQPNS